MDKNRAKYDSRFNSGMYADVDVQYQPPNTYRSALNMRVLFNADGSLAIENDKGNLLSFTLKEYNGDILTDYRPIGSAVFADKVIIFSTDGTNNEIGFVTVNEDGIGIYTQIFNDKYDPNGDNLNFGLRGNNIEAKAVKENKDTENVYFTGGGNQFRVINVQRGSSFNYTPTAGVYPFYYSVHSLTVLCDWDMGRIKYKERIAGTLKTGVYQYSYRQGTKDGYRTPWYPITRHYIMNSQDYVLGTTPYQMQPSNQVTTFGFSFDITGVDVRFPILEMAYLYSITENETVDAGIFYSENLTDAPFTSTINIEHTTHAGDPVSLEEFNTRYYPLRKVKTFEEKDNILFLGNVEEVGVLEPDTSATVIAPRLREMDADVTALNTTDIPYLKPVVADITVQVNSYGTEQESYDIKHEFPTYKGTAFENLFTSYWRGETYRIGVLLFDRKGVPNYVFHIDDFTFPEQYDATGDYVLTVDPSGTGDYKINLLGFTVNNLSIPVDVLYDKDGNLNISGFSIVRAKRVPNTQFQGVIMNTVYENDNTTVNGIAHWRYTRPVPMTENYFNGAVTPVSGSYPNNGKILVGTRATTNKDFVNRAGTFLFYSPELLFGYNSTPVWQMNDNIKAVGVAATVGNEEQQPGYNRVFSSDSNCHFYSKNYRTNGGWANGYSYSLGDVSYIEETGIYKTFLADDFKIENYDIQRNNLIYTQYGQVDFDNSGSDCSDCNIDKFSWGMPDSLLLILKDFKDLSAGTDAVRNQVIIANYQRPSDSYFAGESGNALEKTLYISTGHFQPITTKVITDTEQADGSLLFNNIEVWGGDCYPSFFDFTRLLPQYKDCETIGGCYKDYSVSMIVPLESNINYSMRIGRQFSYASIESEPAACGESSPDNKYIKGIQEKQREDFNINSVLQHEENVQFFPAKPVELTNRVTNPMTILHSEVKYYGETVDNYRRYLANNFFDLTGANGDVTKLFSQYSYIYFLQERGFGRLFINQQATLNSPETGNIVVGSNGTLTGALYISQDIGCQNQFSVFGGHNQTYWVDVNLGKIYRFTQNGLTPLSDKGQHNKVFVACRYYKNRDNPAGIGGIHGVYDYKNNEALFTFRITTKEEIIAPVEDYEFTLSYSENTEAWSTYYSFIPKFYFDFIGRYFSEKTLESEKIYVHLLGERGKYYDEYVDAKLQFVVNPSMDAQKTYDIAVLNVNAEGVETLKTVNISTDINSVSLSLVTDARAKYRHGLLTYPDRGINQVDRIRGKYMLKEYVIENSANKLCRITMEENKFRIVYPI